MGQNSFREYQKKINPPPQRVIWCYSQWRQSYFDMIKTMAEIEFNQDIPEDIDEPDYLDLGISAQLNRSG